MDAIGFALIGVGGYLMYAAYKNISPMAAFQNKIASASSPSTPTINANGGAGTGNYGPNVP